MSYFSDQEYKLKNSQDLWFEKLYFNRWFKDMNGPILDVGCATGNFMAIKPEIFEGIDIDEDSLAKARGRGLKVINLDVNKGMSSLAGNKYEGVYVKQVIEHLFEPLDFMKEIFRILKPGGKAVFLTPNCPYMMKKNFWDDYTHQRPFTKESLKMIAYDAGFRNIKVYQDFRCFPGLGKIIRYFNLKPDQVRRWQSLIGIRGLSLILEIIKE